MAEEPVPSIFELNYMDLHLYQHPPCMFTLWYIGCLINAYWEEIKGFVDNIFGESAPPPPPEAPA